MNTVRPAVLLALSVLLAPVLAPASDAGLAVTNPGFEEPGKGTPAGWGWWSRTGDGSAVGDDGDAHGGKRSALIRHDGPRDWAFSSEKRFDVDGGETFRVRAWANVKKGQVTLVVVARSGGKTLSWDVGSAHAGASGKWTRLDAGVWVPDKAEEIYVRFVGDEETLARVDDVSLVPWTPEAARPREKVKGFAFGRPRRREPMGRGLLARPIAGGKVYLSWRLLPDDPADVTFDVYRRAGDAEPERLNDKPVTKTTDFLDADPPGGTCAYTVRAVSGGKAGEPSSTARATPADEPPACLAFKLDGDYTFQKAGIADLDGDGRYDLVIKQPRSNIDPYVKYWHASEGTYKLEAWNADGKMLWRHDMGWAIERGIWYSPYVVWDLDADGRAEVALKAGEGDPRGEDGKVQSGPEYAVVLDGRTGKPLARAPWPDRKLFGKYNHASRNQIGVAYLDGSTPALLVQRGTYRRMILDAWEFQDGKLRKLWRWDNRPLPRSWWGQGAHRLHAADLDGDGRDEVILGSAVIDDDGSGLWTTGLGHPDHFYLGDLQPARQGLEIYFGIETRRKRNGMCMVCARTGEVLWGYPEPTRHVHGQGLAADLDDRWPGSECYGADTDSRKKLKFARLHTAAGKVVGTEKIGGFAPRAAYWDADPQRELVVRGRISALANYPKKNMARIEGKVIAIADILGDWREEIITSVPGEMRIYSTTLPAADRRLCLMADPVYRIDVACAAMGYFQTPTLGYDLATAGERPAPVAAAIHGGRSATYRNVALNPAATRHRPTSWPHATSNSECRNDPAFFALNAINGRTENTGHGKRFPSWGPDRREDLWWKLDFGRPVEIDKVVLYLRADFPHDRHWQKAMVEFSDGTRLPLKLAKTADPQTFTFEKRTVRWLRLADLVQASPLGWAALTELQAWGRDAETP